MAIWQDMGNAIALLACLLLCCSTPTAILHPTIFWLVNGPRTSDEHGAKSTKKPKPPCSPSNKHIVKLLRWKEPFPPPQGTARWQELQRMVKQLAPADSAYPQAQSAPAPVDPGHSRPLPLVANIFACEQAMISSCLPFQAVVSSIHNAASGADQWQHSTDQAPCFLYQKDSGNTIVEYKEGQKDEVFNDRTTASLWQQVQQFTDLDNDVLLAMIAHLITCPEEDGSSWFFASNFLDYRGVQPRMQADTPGGAKRRAGHRQEDIADVGKSVDRISNIWMTISQFIEEETAGTTSRRKRRTRREYSHRGRLLSIEEAWTQRELATDEPGIELGWKMRAGSWLKIFLESPNRQVASLCQKTLQYDPYREQWEKRLSRYLLFHLRMNARGSTVVFNREIGKLLKELSLPIEEERPQRTRDRFEKALNRLVEDRQIDVWQYKAEVQLPTRHWLGTWLKQNITVYVAPTKHIPAEQEDEESA